MNTVRPHTRHNGGFFHTDKGDYRIINMPLFNEIFHRFHNPPSEEFLVSLGVLAKMSSRYYLDEWAYEYDEDYSAAQGDRRSHNAQNLRCCCRCDHFHNADDELDSKRLERLQSEAEKQREKAEKKRLKKKRQKERKLSEKLKKDEENPVDKEKELNDSAECKDVESKPHNDSVEELPKTICSTLRHVAHEDSSEEESQGSSEELDLTSTFVSKAAVIARRKLEHKSKPEQKAKKSPVKEKPKTVPEKVQDEPLKVVAPSSPKYDDNVRKSTELANMGNQFASAGDYNTAVKYFTDAIKYNPTESKLFGNRSFCFEKMQEYTKALTDAELSLSMSPGWVKGLFRKSRALAGLQRYEEAAQALADVLKADATCGQAQQELKRVSQLMEFTRSGSSNEQSSEALVLHGSAEKAEAEHGGSPRRPVSLTKEVERKPAPPVGTKTPGSNQQPQQELYPVWVGNLVPAVTEATLKNLFKKVGVIHSVKLLSARRCAFINFAHRDSCEEAIRQFHGFQLQGCQLAVRYPDRIPQGMGFSKSALRADHLRDENGGRSIHSDGRNGLAGRRPQRHSDGASH